ncbi:NUDIX hydrolase [Desulfonema ishimotonii]|uniref:NUDIX hydrolase n=1 Tax=Desulfonema ishimotonii TaxID=45657 RepID=A0A401G0R7_9BACT|nr:NUDIX domain-containing protein [Desulfonema ishimotonii]GBC62797.1 NUDIX hydrolase [Desulfonema ishimotonii]
MERFELERPILAVDVVMFGMDRGKLAVLLHEREKEPFRGAPALPGVAVRVDETLASATRRALTEKTNLMSDLMSGTGNGVHIEQLAAFDALYRDPRGRTVSMAFMGIIRLTPETAKSLMWRAVDDIPEGSLPFDHNLILDTAVSRLRGKLRYTNIAREFLPETFQIGELQAVYEAILGTPLNRSNFRNKLLKIGLIGQVSVLSDAVGQKGGRPPHLYRFTKKTVEAVEKDFL